MSEREQKIAAFVAIYGVKRLPYMGKHVDLALWEEANRYADAPRFVAPIADSNEDLLITGIDRTRSFWVVR